MNVKTITTDQIHAFEKHLFETEHSRGTIEKYARDVTAFSEWLGDRELNKENTVAWKNELTAGDYKPATVNSMLSSLNTFLNFLQLPQLRVRQLKIQHRLFRDKSRELTRAEYNCLVSTANSRGQQHLALLLETICSTGIRVSELKYITVEAVRNGKAEIRMKGKLRTILLPGKLCRKLKEYCKKMKITAGEVFRSKSGKSLDRRRIWALMKGICKAAGVEPGKVFPHNLRHLFARRYYAQHKDLDRLADILGHSSIETTRIYLISTTEQTVRELDVLGLVS